MATFRLATAEEKSQEHVTQKGLGSELLLHNARWFTRIRWTVAAVFVLAATAGYLISDTLAKVGLRVPSIWLGSLAGVLLLANVAFVIMMRGSRELSQKAIQANLWMQIIVDLIVVTLVVHAMGSTNTFVAFAYLFHVALACIFFPPRNSLLVVVLAAVLYLIVVILEELGGLYSSGILLPDSYAGVSRASAFRSLLFAGSAVLVWVIVWYFVSTLSTAVRKRDAQLHETNQQLLLANREKNQQMLLTTHDLKAPFAGIESHIQVLRIQFWDELGEPVREVIERIERRAQVLRDRINAILLLGDLRSQHVDQVQFVRVDLAVAVEEALQDLEEKAQERSVNVEADVPSVGVRGDKQQYQILLANLLANAINYSQEGGTVEIRARSDSAAVRLSIADHGIGIASDSLPHIFDEFYRTNEAARFNRMSTGLGLAIVKEIARYCALGVTVTSEKGQGTTFEVAFPRDTSEQT